MNPAPRQPDRDRAAPTLAAYLLGALDFEHCLALQQRLVYEAGGGRDGHISLLICEHSPSITVGRHGSRAEIAWSERMLAQQGLAVRWVNRGGGAVVHAEGQLAVYPVVPLDALGWSVGRYLARLQAGLAATTHELGIAAHTPEGRHGLWGRTGQFAAVGVAVKNWVAYYGAYVNVSPSRRLLSAVRDPRRHRAAMTSLAIERQQNVKMSRVREALLRNVASALDCPQFHLYTGHTLLASARLSYGTTARAS